MNSIKINEVLGAKVFKKIVFKAEHFKYKMIDKLFPNIETKVENRLHKVMERQLADAKSEEEKNIIIANYKKNVLLSRKENSRKRNSNYHIDLNNPNEFLHYLIKNKNIHLKGLLKNAMFYAITIPLVIFSSGTLLTVGYVLLSFNTIFTLINFECVNLQNYNIKRLTASKEKFDRLYQKRLERNQQKYGSISKVVSNEIRENKEIPTLDEIISQIKTKEELEQMKVLLLNELNKRKVVNDTNMALSKKGV